MNLKLVNDRLPEELFQFFRNIIITFDSSWSEERTTAHLDEIRSWIENFYLWILDCSDILNGNNLELLYHRSLYFSERPSFSALDSVLKLTKFSQSSGYTILYEVSILTCLNDMDGYSDFIEKVSVNRICFRLPLKIDDSVSLLLRENINLIMTKAIDKGLLIMLAGSLLQWKNTGILDNLSLNSKSFTFVPETLTKTKSLGNISQDSFSDENEPILAAPCSRRMNLIITPSGSLYPCFGLIGCKEWELGTIRQPIETTLLCDRNTHLALVTFFKKGPQVYCEKSGNDQASLPVACIAHKAALKCP